MSVIFKLVLLPSALTIKCIGADVFILNTGKEVNPAECICGRSLTLSCMFSRDTFAIIWKNADDISSIAKCIQNNCAINPMYDGQYIISFDNTSRIFNLTIMNVTMRDNGRKLVCSDGSHTDYMIIAVRDYNLDLIEDSNSGTVTASSGCVSLDTDVSFKWMKKNACSSIENQFFPKVRFKHTPRCSNHSVCDTNQHIRYREEVFISPYQYHLKVIAMYQHENKESEEVAKEIIVPELEIRSCHLQGKPFSGVLRMGIAAASVVMISIIVLILKRLKMGERLCEKMSKKKIAKRPKSQRDNSGENLENQTTEAQVKMLTEEEKEEVVIHVEE